MSTINKSNVILCRGDRRPQILATTPFNKYNVGESVVQSGLSLSPSDIERLSRKGIAVSTPSADMFQFDSDGSQGFQIRPEYLKDSDRNSMWELSKRSRSNIVKAYKRDQAKYK